MEELCERSEEGPPLPKWLLRELYLQSDGELRLQWDTEHGHWLLQHRHLPEHPKWWTFATWRHSMMDRRLIDTLNQWDTRNTTDEERAAERVLWDLRADAPLPGRDQRVDPDKPAFELEKCINDYCSYPVKIRPQPGADLVRPTANDVAAVGGCSPDDDIVRRTLGGSS